MTGALAGAAGFLVNAESRRDRRGAAAASAFNDSLDRRRREEEFAIDAELDAARLAMQYQQRALPMMQQAEFQREQDNLRRLANTLGVPDDEKNTFLRERGYVSGGTTGRRSEAPSGSTMQVTDTMSVSSPSGHQAVTGGRDSFSGKSSPARIGGGPVAGDRIFSQYDLMVSRDQRSLLEQQMRDARAEMSNMGLNPQGIEERNRLEGIYRGTMKALPNLRPRQAIEVMQKWFDDYEKAQLDKYSVGSIENTPPQGMTDEQFFGGRGQGDQEAQERIQELFTRTKESLDAKYEEDYQRQVGESAAAGLPAPERRVPSAQEIPDEALRLRKQDRTEYDAMQALQNRFSPAPPTEKSLFRPYNAESQSYAALALGGRPVQPASGMNDYASVALGGVPTDQLKASRVASNPPQQTPGPGSLGSAIKENLRRDGVLSRDETGRLRGATIEDLQDAVERRGLAPETIQQMIGPEAIAEMKRLGSKNPRQDAIDYYTNLLTSPPPGPPPTPVMADRIADPRQRSEMAMKPRPQSKEELDALPPGTLYITPNGETRRKR